MKTLEELREDVRDRVDSDEDDTFFPDRRIDAALNAALFEAADKLGMTVARRRWMKRIADLNEEDDFDAETLIWELPEDFRRPFLIKREHTPVKEVADERKFSDHGVDGYMIMGRQLLLTEDTDPVGIEVYYVYKPATMTADDDTPDFVEGYEEYLVARAAATLCGKADTGDPKVHLDDAARLWNGLMFAVRNSAMPGNIRRARDPYEEDWM